MRWILRLLGGLAFAVGALIVVAFLLPREVAVARSTVIEAEPAAIFPHVNALEATAAWSPWLDRDPNVVVIYDGPGSGVGSRMTWASEVPTVGNGTQEITESLPDERVTTALDFGPQGTAMAVFDLVEVEGGTEVTWGFTTDLGLNPVARWMGLMMDGWIGGDYEVGLANLKALVEGG